MWNFNSCLFFAGYEAVGAYEVAAAAKPDNMELQQALFGALVRGEHFAKQQQVGVTSCSFKGIPTSRYCFCDAVSTVYLLTVPHHTIQCTIQYCVLVSEYLT